MRKRLAARRSQSVISATLVVAIGLLVYGASVLPAAARERFGNNRAGHDQSWPQDHAGGRRGQGWEGRGQFRDTVFAAGATIYHPGPSAQEPVSKPDDITSLDGHIFVCFQNGLGPQGQPSATGNTDSTIVEFDRHGGVVNQWDIVGKCDGFSADPWTHRLIATVNEDANSSLYTIDPSGHGSVVHCSYSDPLPHNGGTDAISIYHGTILISASAPGTTGAAAPQPTYPAVYRVALDSTTDLATVQPLFYDEDSATVANWGSPQSNQTVSLGLTDPDSNSVVPFYAPRFAGDFMLTSQGDQQQIFVRDAGTPWQSLSVLNLSDSVDDTAWPSSPRGAIFATDSSHDTVNEITGPFWPGQVFVVDTPCGANSAPSTCPAPGFPANFLGRLNSYTGTITPVTVQGPAFEPQGGMLFLPRSAR